MWECGLKPFALVGLQGTEKVTPYVGVWIETLLSPSGSKRWMSHSLCGSVD